MWLQHILSQVREIEKREAQEDKIYNLLIKRGHKGINSFEGYNGLNIKRLPARMYDLVESKGVLLNKVKLGDGSVTYILKGFRW